MSSYIKPTVNPDTHEVEEAEWLDDYFGQHNYGVRFPSTGIVYRYDEYEWFADESIKATRALKHLGGATTRKQTVAGKFINTVEHDNGRKDVTIEVKSLDVDMSDPSNIEAKKVIEEQILPALANKKILVTLIHKPTNTFLSFVARLPEVRSQAEKAAASHAWMSGRELDLAEYCLVQQDKPFGDVPEITVTTL